MSVNLLDPSELPSSQQIFYDSSSSSLSSAYFEAPRSYRPPYPSKILGSWNPRAFVRSIFFSSGLRVDQNPVSTTEGRNRFCVLSNRCEDHEVSMLALQFCRTIWSTSTPLCSSRLKSAATMGNIGLQSEISPCERYRGVGVMFGGVWLFD